MQFSILRHATAILPMPFFLLFLNIASSFFFSMCHGIHGVVVSRAAKLDPIVYVCNMRFQCLISFEAVLNDY